MPKSAKRTKRPTTKNGQPPPAERKTPDPTEPDPDTILCITCHRHYPPNEIAHRVGEHTARGICFGCAATKPARTWWT